MWKGNERDMRSLSLWWMRRGADLGKIYEKPLSLSNSAHCLGGLEGGLRGRDKGWILPSSAPAISFTLWDISLCRINIISSWCMSNYSMWLSISIIGMLVMIFRFNHFVLHPFLPLIKSRWFPPESSEYRTFLRQKMRLFWLCKEEEETRHETGRDEEVFGVRWHVELGQDSTHDLYETDFLNYSLPFWFLFLPSIRSKMCVDQNPKETKIPIRNENLLMCCNCLRTCNLPNKRICSSQLPLPFFQFICRFLIVHSFIREKERKELKCNS